jgi:hypothetical protein
MNYSVNYSGFVDLAIGIKTIQPTLTCCEDSENCKPAIAIQLYQDQNIDELMQGATMINPIKKQDSEPEELEVI